MAVTSTEIIEALGVAFATKAEFELFLTRSGIVVDATAAAAFTAETYAAYLHRAKLRNDLAALESAERNLRTEFATDTGEFNATLEANQAAQNAKQAEIDVL